MSIQNFFKSLISTSRRRPIRHRPVAGRLQVEPLEDRCLPSFLGPVNYAVGLVPQSGVSADFNNDAILDLAVANSGSNTVSLLLGNGNGTFQPARNSATGTWPLSLATGDFNADGKLDLVTTNNPLSLSVLLGNGDGTFQPPKNTALNYGNSPAVGDVNADGKLDLVTVWSESINGNSYGRVSTRLGNGNGTFAAPTTKLLDSAYLTAGVLSDFNADAKLDLATTDYVHGVRVLAGNGDGTFGAPTDYTSGWGASIVVGDVNGDGISDLITQASVLLGNGSAGVGDGTFHPVQDSGLNLGPYSLAVGDFNADGKLDLVSTSSEYTGGYSGPDYYTGSIHVLLGHGDGTFAAPRTSTVWDSAFSGPATGDLNGDGFSDVTAIRTPDSYSGSDSVSVLLNDGSWPTAITVNDVTVTEGNSGTTAATFTVSISPAYGQTVSVHYETADGYYWNSATAGADYQANTGTLTFAPGVTSQTITVQVYGDRLGESSESFSVLLTDPTNAFVDDAQGVGTIVDDEPTVSIVEYVEGAEGNTGATPFIFTVTLSAAYDVPVSVDYATSELTPDEEYWYGGPGATAGIDYTATSGALTIPAGQTSGTITVLVHGDRLSEGEAGYYSVELFLVKLTGATGASISTGQSGGYIVDDDPLLSISIGGGGTVVEGNSGTKSLTFTIALSAASDAPVTVTYATANSTATAGSDYQAANGTLTFAPGQSSKTITVLVNGDRLAEPNETFVVNLSAPTNATIADGQGSGTILDDEPRMSINNVTVTEGNAGTVNATFTVSLSVAYDVAVTVHDQTANGSATAGSDYAAASGDVTIAAGQTTKTFTALVIGDRSAEPTETFVVNLSAATNGLIVDSQGVGTILDNEPRISIRDVTKAEGKKNQTTLFTFTVTLSVAYDQAVTMSFRTANGTATTNNNDYIAKTGTLTFAPGETTKTITIEVNGDSKKEADETFYLDLFGNSGNSLFTNTRGIGTILNDD